MRKFVFLSAAQPFADFMLLLLRVFVGLFLIWSVLGKVLHSDQMVAFADFLAKHHFPSPELLARVSVYSQLLAGGALVLGLFTRWAGILCAINFAVAIAMVDRFEGMRGVFPSGFLVGIGLYLATYGAGRISIDSALRANEIPRHNGGVTFRK
jgi:putative oxidoreductase